MNFGTFSQKDHEQRENHNKGNNNSKNLLNINGSESEAKICALGQSKGIRQEECLGAESPAVRFNYQMPYA